LHGSPVEIEVVSKKLDAILFYVKEEGSKYEMV
jgi:hypothetical protein